METKQDLINLLKEKEKWVKNYVDKGKLDIEVYYDDDFTNIQRFKGRMKYYETIKEISILKQSLEVIENQEAELMAKWRADVKETEKRLKEYYESQQTTSAGERRVRRDLDAVSSLGSPADVKLTSEDKKENSKQ